MKHLAAGVRWDTGKSPPVEERVTRRWRPMGGSDAWDQNVSFSTRFQFGDHLGVGVRRGQYDIGLRLQHLSNAGLRNPNPGVNFLQLHLAYELH